MRTPGESLAEKEFILIQEIAKSPTHTQRSLSQNIGLSLGTTNLLIQRLARKGYIKITQLDWKRTQYLLTLKGAMEKTNKAYHYTLYTMRLFRQIQENITTLLRREYAAGQRHFTIVSQDEILELLRDSIASLGLSNASFCYLKRFEEVPPETDLILSATLEPSPEPCKGRRYASLVDFDNIDFRIG
jgi:DNA-binding MarR family transcriptional regulator